MSHGSRVSWFEAVWSHLELAREVLRVPAELSFSKFCARAVCQARAAAGDGRFLSRWPASVANGLTRNITPSTPLPVPLDRFSARDETDDESEQHGPEAVCLSGW